MVTSLAQDREGAADPDLAPKHFQGLRCNQFRNRQLVHSQSEASHFEYTLRRFSRHRSPKRLRR